MWLGFALALASAGAAAQTVMGSGTSGTVPVFNGTSTVTNSPIAVSGGNVGIGTTSPWALLDVQVAPGYNFGAFNNTAGAASIGAFNNGFTAWEPLSINPGGPVWFMGGSVGVGTTGPDATVDAVGTSRFELTSSAVITSALMNAGTINDVIRINAPYSASPATVSNVGAAWGIRFIGATDPSNNDAYRNTTSKGPAIFAVSEDTLGYNRMNGLAFYTNTQDTAAAERLRINNVGNVGIGTTTPSQKLEVAGYIQVDSGIYFPGNSTPQTVPWTGVLCGGDYAESVDVTGNRTNYEPGDLLVIDPSAPGKFLKSAEAYSTLVAGIYSTKPGAVGRRQTTMKSPDEVPMAMIGIVPTKVSAENGPIKAGDLLVTSSTMGHAMKGTDRDRMLGAVIGKALGSLDSGTGVIDVVVTLQ